MGSKTVSLEVDNHKTVADVLDLLFEHHPQIREYIYKDGELDRNYLIALNKERVDPARLEEFSLSEGDEVAILPPAGGG